MLKEKHIQTAIINLLQARGHYVVRVNSWSIMKSYKTKCWAVKQHRIKLADEGTPDVIVCIRWLFIGIEVKRDDKESKSWWSYPEKYKEGKRKLNKRINAQHFTRSKILKSGWEYWLVHSIDQVLEWMTRIEKLNPNVKYKWTV